MPAEFLDCFLNQKRKACKSARKQISRMHKSFYINCHKRRAKKNQRKPLYFTKKRINKNIISENNFICGNLKKLDYIFIFFYKYRNDKDVCLKQFLFLQELF